MTIIIDESTFPKINEKLLYPQRKRCRKCRCFFAFMIVDRLFCSYTCADVEPPSHNPDDWPRKHSRYDYEIGTWVEKRYFNAPEEVESRHFKSKTQINLYYCDYCHAFHLGRSRSVA